MLSTKCHPIFRHLQINIVDVFVPSRKCSLEKIAKWPYYYYWSSSMRKYLVFLSDTFSWSPKNGILPRKFVKNGVWSTTYDLVAAAVGVTEIQAFKRFNTRLQFFWGVKTQNWIFVIQICCSTNVQQVLDYWDPCDMDFFKLPWLLGKIQLQWFFCPYNPENLIIGNIWNFWTPLSW